MAAVRHRAAARPIRAALGCPQGAGSRRVAQLAAPASAGSC
jgi:hypothetical protein